MPKNRPSGPGAAPGATAAPRHGRLSGGRPVVLVLRALGLGDLLTAVPALRALRRALPEHELVLAAPRELAPVARATGCVDRLLDASGPGRSVPALLPGEARGPHLAVNLHGRGPASHRLLAGLGPERLWAFRHPEVPGVRGPAWIPDEHERLRWCRLLRWYGPAADPDDVLIAPPAGARSPLPGAVVVHPGAQAAARRWPVDRFAAVVRGVRRAGLPVLVTAGPGEGPLARSVAEHAGLPPSAVMGGDGAGEGIPFEELCGLVAAARCVVVGDTGLAHLATALGTRSVVLFGPVSPALWGPPENGRHRALWHPGHGPAAGSPGDPHADRPDPRLLEITVDEVLEAVLALSASAAPAADAGRPTDAGRPAPVVEAASR
ncbi:glycosyltransferase family 9 protein [Streptomyces sp. NPDC012769]|uniref:glycosyltransferase family 9 protein n=1 Tax=Streptomyces sp. NPDC012769 TaxID=3364848 RepID=UPI0036C8EAD2